MKPISYLKNKKKNYSVYNKTDETENTCKDNIHLNANIFYKCALIANEKFDENSITENYLGPMNVLCKFCKAKHFTSEMTKRNNFNNCCHNGKVILPEDKKYPDEIKNLILENSSENTKFLKNIRIYNNMLAFASFGAKFDYLKTRGPRVFRICGQVYHNIYSLHPNENESRKYGQLYILDNKVANNIRLQNNEKNTDCDLNILKKLDIILREINIYAKTYKMMYEVEKKEFLRCKKLKIPMKNIYMYLVRENSSNKSYLNSKACNEVAVVFSSENGEAVINRDFCIYSKNNTPQSIPIISKHLDPMTYPLLFPHGDFGWSPYMYSLNKEN